MGRNFKPDEPWMPEAAELMARTGISLKQALTQLGVALTTHECELIEKRKSFNALLWTARNRYNQEVAANPERNKTALIGELLVLAQKLIAEGSLDKAGEVLFKVGRLENWVGEGGTVNVFAGLTQKDIDEMKKALETEGAKPLIDGQRTSRDSGTKETKPN